MYQSSVHVMWMSVVCRSVIYFFIPVVGKISTKVLRHRCQHQHIHLYVTVCVCVLCVVCVCVYVRACVHGVGVCMHAIFHASVSVCFLLDGFL